MTNTLLLHDAYSRDEAIALLAPGATRSDLCDGEFVATPDAVAAFFTVGEPIGAVVQSPTDITWRPSRTDYAPREQYPFLPREAREVAHTCTRRHHLFMRHASGERYHYLGLAHLGSYGGSPLAPAAHFALDRKLPMALWLALGGYPEWEMATHDASLRLRADETARFAQLLADIFSKPHAHVTLTRYRQDSLQCFTNAHRAWFMYLRTPDDTGLHVSDPSGSGDPEHFRCDCGISLDFPRANTVDHAAAHRILTEFFVLGELPNAAAWTDEA